MATDWLKLVSEARTAGFQKVTVINKSYQCLGASAPDAIAKAWNKTDKEGKTTLINENQELMNNWPPKNGTFHFFQETWNVIQGGSKVAINAKGGNGKFLIARDIDDHWILATCKVQDMMGGGKKKDKKKGPKVFKSNGDALAAFKTALDAVDLEEEEG